MTPCLFSHMAGNHRAELQATATRGWGAIGCQLGPLPWGLLQGQVSDPGLAPWRMLYGEVDLQGSEQPQVLAFCSHELSFWAGR